MSAESYLEALNKIGIIEVVGVDLGYYQGDYVAAVLESDYDASAYYASERIGLLVIGYGSCSGCDGWEAASTAKDRLKVLADLVDGIKWFDNLEGMKAYLASDDPELQWYAHEDKWPGFVEKVNSLGEYNQVGQ